MIESWDWPGARWWRVDLHAHSPESYDFTSASGPADQDWEQWLSAARDAGMHAIAVTDHNTAEGLHHLQTAVPTVVNAPVIFPGVELTASDGSHLLLIMDLDCNKQHVEEQLSKLGITVDKRGKRDSRSVNSVEQILNACGDDVLVIGAHVNSPAGLLKHGGQQGIGELRHPRLAAVDIDPCKPVDERWLNGDLPEIGRKIPKVWASDGHKLCDLGRRFTWVKMTRPNLEGLRLALLDGADSLKPASRTDTADPNAHASLAIESITVQNGQFIGKPSLVEVRFNPWLNAIIGGRGTGKSTLIDFCRKTLRREGDLDGSNDAEEGSLRSLFDRRMRVPASQSEGLLTDNTRIDVVYRKDDERFTLSWSQDGKAQPIARMEGATSIPEDGDIRERFPVRIYSQKQLFALAQDPNALLSVIDDSQDVRGPELDRQLSQMESRFLSVRAAARAAAEQAAELPARIALLRDLQRKLAMLQQGGHAQVLNEYRIRRQQNDNWEVILEASEQALRTVAHSAGDLAAADLDLVVTDTDDPAAISLIRAHGALGKIVHDLQTNLRQSVEEARLAIESVKSGSDAVRWREAVAASTARFHAESSQLAEAGVSDPNEYGDLLENLARVQREIEELERDRERSEKLELDAAVILSNYREVRRVLSDRRSRFAEHNTSANLRVMIDTNANHASLAGDLSEILGIQFFEGDRREVARRIRPELNDSWAWDRLDTVIGEMRRFTSGKLDTWATQDQRFTAALKRVPPERIDRLGLYLPKDKVNVSFRDDEHGPWKSIDQGSPGQQTAALLAFVLSYGREPIILDQPEDDLDNSLIYELLVNQLRQTKLTRQVIVVTHNPNIVVHGDAEYVISLNTKNGQTSIAAKGGLQERSVRDEICRVMEGGEIAFETRYRRIMPLRGV